MAIQYSYPKALGINSTDLLFGSQTNGEFGIKNVTKNFQVGALADFITSTLPFQSLTTDGIDGPSTLIDGVLNVPTYTYNPGYRMYTVLLTQTSTTAPSKNVLYNTLGTWAIEFARTAVGTYTATISGHLSNFNSAWYALTDNRLSFDDGNYIMVNKTASTVITIYTYKAGVLSDGILSNTPFEIRVFD
jgi:hypothetical protein